MAISPLPTLAQRTPIPAQSVIPAPGPPYALYADLVLAAPVIVDATVRSTTRIKGPEAVDVAPGFMRLYVEADVLALVRAGAPVPPRIGYVVDVAVDSSGRPPRLKKSRVLLFARALPNSPKLLQLVGPGAQRAWSPAVDTLVRRITTETLAPGAPLAISGIGNAFHVAGTLPGEGETQIFLMTAGGDPVSLSIVRQPDQPRRWAVSLSEIVDQSAEPPARDTLLWYRLACALPASLPDSSLESADPESAAIARDDYRFVVESLGRCNRS